MLARWSAVMSSLWTPSTEIYDSVRSDNCHLVSGLGQPFPEDFFSVLNINTIYVMLPCTQEMKATLKCFISSIQSEHEKK